MALRSQDDKFLGEKVDNYCSSSEDEAEEEAPSATEFVTAPSGERNTGPKGVIEDWKAFKREELSRKLEEEKQNEQKIRDMLITCNDDIDLDDEDKEFLEEYSKQRMVEMQHKFSAKSAGVCFGKVIDLDQQNYVEEIENEKEFVSILIHIYDDRVAACKSMNGCFEYLASQYKSVKFCRIKVTDARMSANFQENALPALLVYKNNTVMATFIRVSDQLGEDFFADEVEAFLKPYSLLPMDERSVV